MSHCVLFSLTLRACEGESPKAGSPNLGDFWGQVILVVGMLVCHRLLTSTPAPTPATSLSYL